MSSPTRSDEAYRKFAVAPARPNSKVSVPELPAPSTEPRPTSPIQRSGSPLRRKQIHDLETLPRKKLQLDAPQSQDESALVLMAESVERISNTFAITATGIRDAKLFQKDIMLEIAELRRDVRQLQADMKTLLERSR